MNYDVKQLGQVFTPKDIVNKMISMIKNNGRILEPSCGNGAFSDEIPNCVAIEIDKNQCPNYAINMDFFELDINEKFDTIIGNPPYVRYKDILETTKKHLNLKIFNERTNLYIFFIYKCIQHLNDKGELIFITPREFLKSTSSIPLNNYLYEQGTITDIIELGDQSIFDNHNPNVVIFRFEKGNFSRITNGNKIFKNINGQLLFLENDIYTVNFNDLFYVKVGATSGADRYFISEKGNMEFVYSKTRKTNQTRRMFYNVEAKELLPYKNELLNRKIKKFNERNWFEWGRNVYISDKERVYVNFKTRMKDPFFTHSCKNYDGSILGIFPKFEVDIDEITKMLNEVNWEELGFVCDGRYIFTQKALENTILPKSFEKFLK